MLDATVVIKLAGQLGWSFREEMTRFVAKLLLPFNLLN